MTSLIRPQDRYRCTSTSKMSAPTTEWNAADRDSSGWSANAYNSAAHFVYSAKNTANVLGLLNAQPGERIVDFGCGSGEVTIELIKAVGEKGEVAATDISSSMVGHFLRMHGSRA